MPNTNFTWTTITPATQDQDGLPANTSIVIEVTAVNDQVNYPGDFRLVPDLATMRQVSSNLIRQYTNISAVSDPNGNITTPESLTGGYAALRQYVIVSGARVYDALPTIPCGVAYAPGYGTSAVDLALNNNKVRLVLDPAPGGVTTNPLDGNKRVSLYFNSNLPFVVVPIGIGIDSGDTGGGGA